MPSKTPGLRGWHILFFPFLYSLWDLIQVSTWILCLAEFTWGEQQRQMSKEDLISVKMLGKEKIKGILCFWCTWLYYQQVTMMAKSGPPGFNTWAENPEKPGVTGLKSVLKPNSPWHPVFLFGFGVVFVFGVWAFLRMYFLNCLAVIYYARLAYTGNKARKKINCALQQHLLSSRKKRDPVYTCV